MFEQTPLKRCRRKQEISLFFVCNVVLLYHTFRKSISLRQIHLLWHKETRTKNYVWTIIQKE